MPKSSSACTKFNAVSKTMAKVADHLLANLPNSELLQCFLMKTLEIDRAAKDLKNEALKELRSQRRKDVKKRMKVRQQKRKAYVKQRKANRNLVAVRAALGVCVEVAVC